MKHLTLIRHAKSSWKERGLSDRDRPLNKRGRRDAPLMGQRLAERGVAPDLLISSPAVRACATAQVIAQAISYPVADIRLDKRLYGASAPELLEIIQGLDDAYSWVMLFSHNPGLTELVNLLSADDGIDDVPTCGVIEFTFDTPAWISVGYLEPTEMTFDYPKKPQDEQLEVSLSGC